MSLVAEIYYSDRRLDNERRRGASLRDLMHSSKSAAESSDQHLSIPPPVRLNDPYAQAPVVFDSYGQPVNQVPFGGGPNPFLPPGHYRPSYNPADPYGSVNLHSATAAPHRRSRFSDPLANVMPRVAMRLPPPPLPQPVPPPRPMVVAHQRSTITHSVLSYVRIFGFNYSFM